MPSTRLNYGVILSLFLLLFTGLADNQMIAALLPVLVRSFHVTVGMAGMLVVVYSIAAAAAGFTFGTLSDRYGRRRFLLGGVIAFALASWMAAETRTFSELMAARVLTGGAAGTISTCVLTYAGDCFEYSVRGRAIGLISIAYFAAPIVGVPAAAQIAQRYGWRGTFLFFAFVACIAAASMWLLRGERPVFARTAGDMRSVPRVLKSFLNRRDLAAGIVIAFFASGGMVGFLTYIGEWLNSRFALSESGIGWVFMFGGAVAVIGAPFGGMLSDRWGKRLVSIIGCVLLAASLAVMPFIAWGVLLLAIFGLTSLGTSFRQGPITALMTELIAGERRGSYMAARGVSSQLGIGAAALAGGLLYEHYGYAAVTGLCAVMTVCVIVLLAGYIAEPEPLSPGPLARER